MRARLIIVPTSLLLIAALTGGCVAHEPGWTYNPSGKTPTPASTSPSQEPSATPSSTQDGVGQAGQVMGSIEFHAFDLGFDPAQTSVEMAGTYDVSLQNDGAIAHDITFPDGTTAHAEPGQSATAQVVVPEGGLDFICSVPGHADAGMRGHISVAGGVAGVPSPDASAEPAATTNPDDHGG